MVLIESMASGTPIVAFGRGAVPEIVRDGRTGFVVDSVESMVEAIASIEQISRRDCRRHVDDHFSIHRMAERYEAVYERLADPRPASGRKACGFAMRPDRRVEVA